jgi:hypothetical protein
VTPAAKGRPAVEVWPAITLFTLTTPETYYKVLSQQMVASGYLNRQLNIEGEARPKLVPRPASVEVPAGLAGRLKALVGPLPQHMQQLQQMQGGKPEIKLDWSEKAERVWIELEAELREERDPTKRNLYMRVPEMTVRLGSLVAFGRFDPVGEVEDMLWGRAWALQSAKTLYDGFTKYSEETLSLNELCRKIVEWLGAAEGGWMLRRDINRAARPWIRRGADVEDALKYLEDSGEIKLEVKTSRGSQRVELVKA